MQLILSAPDKSLGYVDSDNYTELFRHYLATQKISVFRHDIEMSYNDFHKCWDISIFRYSKNSVGSGTRAYRDAKWQNDVDKIKSLFPMSALQSTWRWAKYHRHYDAPQDFDSIPGIRFFVDCGVTTPILSE